MMKDQVLVLCILNQIYKCPEGNYMAIGEVLQDSSRHLHDPFLLEMDLRVWRRSGQLLLLEKFDEVSVKVFCYFF